MNEVQRLAMIEIIIAYRMTALKIEAILKSITTKDK
jgi:hypothetical protein